MRLRGAEARQEVRQSQSPGGGNGVASDQHRRATTARRVEQMEQRLLVETVAQTEQRLGLHGSLGALIDDRYGEDALHAIGEAYTEAIVASPERLQLQLAGNVQGAVLALQADPGLAEAHFNFAAALRELGRPDEARVHIEEAVRLRPDLAGRAP